MKTTILLIAILFLVGCSSDDKKVETGKLVKSGWDLEYIDDPETGVRCYRVTYGISCLKVLPNETEKAVMKELFGEKSN